MYGRRPMSHCFYREVQACRVNIKFILHIDIMISLSEFRDIFISLPARDKEGYLLSRFVWGINANVYVQFTL